MSSLENACVKLIIREFTRYFIAFKKTDNATLKHHLNFLHRNYALEIITKLYSAGKWQYVYLEFLLNPNLKQLNCHWLRSLNEGILKRLPNLTKISFLYDCRNEHIKLIAKHCPQLQELNVKCSRVTDEGIIYLCRNENGKIACPQLKILFVVYTRVTGKCINYLVQNLPSLEKIDYSSTIPRLLYTLHKDDSTDETRKYNLTSLDFTYVYALPNFTDILKICLAVCPRLQFLELRHISSQEQLDLFKNFHLKRVHLNIEHQNINTANFFKENGFRLSHLKLENCAVSMSDLTVSCPKLNSLWITDVTFTDSENSSQPIFNCLTKCTISFYEDSTSNKTIQSILLCSPKLEYIGFTCCTLSRETKIHILQYCEKRTMKKIFFNYSNVDWPFIKTIFFNFTSTPIVIYLNPVRETQDYLRYKFHYFPNQLYLGDYPLEHFWND